MVELDVQVSEKVMGTAGQWSSDLAAAMRVLDRMRELGHRWLLNADTEGFHLRRVVWVVHDGVRDEKKYVADKPLGWAKTLGELPKVICEAALDEVGAHESAGK